MENHFPVGNGKSEEIRRPEESLQRQYLQYSFLIRFPLVVQMISFPHLHNDHIVLFAVTNILWWRINETNLTSSLFT